MDAKREKEAVLNLTRLIQDSVHTTVLTGPGLSLEAGIPGLWGMTGAWEGLPVFRYVTARRLMEDPRAQWGLFRDLHRQARSARPTPMHYALARLEASGDIDWILTLSVDDLLEKAGCRRVVHLFGRLSRLRCSLCEKVSNAVGVERPLQAPCSCGGLFRPDITLGDETPDSSILSRAVCIVKHTQLLLCMGVTGLVPPVTLLAHAAASGGGRTLYVESGVTSFPRNVSSFHLRLPFQPSKPSGTRSLSPSSGY